MRYTPVVGVVWGLKKRDPRSFGSLLTASGNFLAPCIYPSREDARKAARQYKSHGIDCVPTLIEVAIRVKEVR